MSTDVKKFKRKLEGVVVSAKSQKTVVVKVERKLMHAKYNKYVKVTKKYHAHDEEGKAKEGDTVSIIESRPCSKLKKWEMVKVVKSADIH